MRDGGVDNNGNLSDSSSSSSSSSNSDSDDKEIVGLLKVRGSAHI